MWTTQIKVNTTQVHEQMNHPVDTERIHVRLTERERLTKSPTFVAVAGRPRTVDRVDEGGPPARLVVGLLDARRQLRRGLPLPEAAQAHPPPSVLARADRRRRRHWRCQRWGRWRRRRRFGMSEFDLIDGVGRSMLLCRILQ